MLGFDSNSQIPSMHQGMHRLKSTDQKIKLLAIIASGDLSSIIGRELHQCSS